MPHFERLAQMIESMHDELIYWTQALIQIPTINPPGENYADICQLLKGWLIKEGFCVELIRAHGTPGDSARYPRWNLIAEHRGPCPGPRIHFNSHIDVVEVGGGWTCDPFAALYKDGCIFGRGACDMKGGLASSLLAAIAYVRLFPEHPGCIEISATGDEESGGYGGVAYLAERGYFDPQRVQHVIIPEPLHKDRICLGHRGVWWAEIQTFGKMAHGSMPFLGDCAVRHMGAVLQEMEHTLYPALASKRTQMPVVPEGAKNSTMNINALHGGAAEGFDGLPAPCVPDSARMVIDRRFLIEESLDEVKAEVASLLERVAAARPGFRYQMQELFCVAPVQTDQDAPIVRTVAAAINSVLGRTAEYVVSPGTYDQKHIDRIGRMHNCIAYGPGLLELAHQADEYIRVDDMMDSAKVMAVSLWTLLNE